MIVAILEPIEEPMMELDVAYIATWMSITLCLAYLADANNVPKNPENLFVPRAICGGIPKARYAGSVIIPPPPAIESTKPPKLIKAIRNIKFVDVISVSTDYITSKVFLDLDKLFEITRLFIK